MHIVLVLNLLSWEKYDATNFFSCFCFGSIFSCIPLNPMLNFECFRGGEENECNLHHKHCEETRMFHIFASWRHNRGNPCLFYTSRVWIFLISFLIFTYLHIYIIGKSKDDADIDSKYNVLDLETTCRRSSFGHWDWKPCRLKLELHSGWLGFRIINRWQ